MESRRLSIAIGVVGHNKRGEQAAALTEQVGAVYRSVDNSTLGVTGNHRRVWETLACYPTTWTVVLEDDAQPVDGFRHELDEALKVAPSPVVGLYLGHPEHWSGQRRKRVETAIVEADRQDACFITTTEILHGVGVAIRTDLIESMLAHTATSSRPFDFAVRNWARDNRMSVAFTAPSLVDHADGPTLVEHPDSKRRGRRKAWKAAGREHWTAQAVNF